MTGAGGWPRPSCARPDRSARHAGQRRYPAHGQAAAEFIHQADGEFVFPIKENRQALFDALDALPWREVPVAHTATDRGHGRITTRTIQVLPAPEDLPFPHAGQAS